jgi:predicted phosphodiesterase
LSDLLPVAVISDVHGNRWALEAVLEDIRGRGITTVVNLGDCFYGPLDPAGTARLLTAAPMVTVRGNEDSILTGEGADDSHSPSLRFTRESLAAEHLAWVASLPLTARVGSSFLLCHGTPARDDEYLLHDVGAEGARRREPAEIRDRLSATDAPIVLCGHDHIPALAELEDGRLVVDPGSVGLPAYADGSPQPHVMAAGSHHARYALIDRAGKAWRVAHVALSYDWQAAAKTASRNGREDWAEWLTSGRARLRRGCP